MLLKDAVTGTNTAEVKRSKYNVVNINYKIKAFEKKLAHEGKPK